MTTALIDADVLRYEVGSTGQNEDGLMSFEYVSTVLDEKIASICDAAESDRPVLYLTEGSNFRDSIAVSKPYKGQRKNEKPWHFKNLTVYMKNQYDTVIADGLEADDLMSIRQYAAFKGGTPDDTVICTRDKDLLMIPGWHYQWECGHQREMHKHFVEPEGHLYMEGNKLKGTGMSWFYAQLLMGDNVDNIPGCPKVGPVKAYKILKDLHVSLMLDAVKQEYEDRGMTEEYLLEQGQLLWMIRELKDDKPVMWTP